jgi:DoxX-like family
MHTQTTEMFQHVTDVKLATLSRSRWYRIRSITYWTFTVLLVFELAAGSLWNLLQIEWVRVQLNHLGYPPYYTYISGVWQIGGAAVIIAPGFTRLKEWAYAGSFFQFSGAVGARAGDASSRLGRSDRDPPSSICRFVSNAARGQRRLPPAGS